MSVFRLVGRVTVSFAYSFGGIAHFEITLNFRNSLGNQHLEVRLFWVKNFRGRAVKSGPEMKRQTYRTFAEQLQNYGKNVGDPVTLEHTAVSVFEWERRKINQKVNLKIGQFKV